MLELEASAPTPARVFPMTVRLDPTLDVVFHLLFSDARNKALLISLLEAVLQPPVPIGEVTVLNPTLPKELVGDRGAELDLLVCLQDGRRVNVGMQSQRVRPPEAGLFLTYSASCFKISGRSIWLSGASKNSL